MEGVNEDIENWSVSQVLSWLKSTNDGQFDEFVSIFKQHQIYGDALLSLTNDILRDELGIIAYGARHALLKAISNLKQSYQSRRELQLKLKQIKFNISQQQRRKSHGNKSSNNININIIRNRKASMSSICSKASQQTKTSHTYCVGDLNNQNSGDTIPGIDDNWENLNTMAKHGVVDASEYLKQAKLIVKAVTGTTIKLTRKGSGDENVYKSGFFEFEDKIPDWNKIESQSAIKYVWNVDRLAWDKSYIVVKIAENPFSRGSLRVSYYCLHLNESLNMNMPSAKGYYSRSGYALIQKNKNKHKISESMSVPADVALQGVKDIDVKDNNNDNDNNDNITMLSPYFSAASLPEADEKIDISENDKILRDKLRISVDENDEKSMDELIHENEEKSMVSKESPTFTATNTINTISTKTNLQTQKGDLVSRLLGFENKYGGNLIVAKQSIDLTESVQTYFNDVRTQSVSQLFANEYNKYNPPKKVAFIKASVIQLLESECEQFFCVEDYLHGAYMKHLDNYGGDEGIRNTPSAFAHFTYEASQHRLLVCDIQGVGDLYTDPQIHTFNCKGFGKGNLGIDGMIKFLKTHQCNAICQHLRLDIVNPKPIVYGTRPAKMYMDRNKISVINGIDQLNTDEYHKIPKIPISTLNDYYLQQIYKMDRDSNKKYAHHKSICENHKNSDNTLEDIMSDDPNTVNTRYSRHQSNSCQNNSNTNTENESEDEYNPLTPLINHVQDYEDTKCGLCNCSIL